MTGIKSQLPIPIFEQIGDGIFKIKVLLWLNGHFTYKIVSSPMSPSGVAPRYGLLSIRNRPHFCTSTPYYSYCWIATGTSAALLYSGLIILAVRLILASVDTVLQQLKKLLAVMWFLRISCHSELEAWSLVFPWFFNLSRTNKHVDKDTSHFPLGKSFVFIGVPKWIFDGLWKLCSSWVQVIFKIMVFSLFVCSIPNSNATTCLLLAFGGSPTPQSHLQASTASVDEIWMSII